MERATESLYDFTVQAWEHVESQPFVDNWHIGAICEHLEAVTRGEIDNLLINIPPGCTKSLLCSVMWFCWEWASWPSRRWMYISYHQSLAARDSVKCRNLINSKWYKERWGHRFDWTDDQNQKIYYENTAGGYRLATTPGGRGTGDHPDRIVFDDPHNVRQAESELERQQVTDWWDLTMTTRGASRGAKRVGIMQRLHELDLTGHIIKSNDPKDWPDDWTVICLPMRYEPGRMKRTVLGFIDPRTTEGELLHPKLFTEKITTRIENALGPYGTAGQLQQRPSPLEGGMFKRAWFEVVPECPKNFDYMVRGWDLAGTEGDGDWTVGALLGVKGDDVYVIDIIRGQWLAGQRDEYMRIATEGDDEVYGRNKVETWLPQDPGQAGKGQAAIIATKLLVGHRVRYETMTGDKETRADSFASRAWAGERSGNKVKIVRAPWNTRFLNELCVFPNGAHDDIVDAVALAFSKLAKGKRKLAIGV